MSTTGVVWWILWFLTDIYSLYSRAKDCGKFNDVIIEIYIKLPKFLTSSWKEMCDVASLQNCSKWIDTFRIDFETKLQLYEMIACQSPQNLLCPFDLRYYLCLVGCLYVCIYEWMFSGDYDHTVNAMAFKFCEKFPLINI